MEREVFKKIESRLYNYFNQIKTIEKIKNKVSLLYKQLDTIIEEKKNLKNLKIEIGLNMGIDYSKDKVQTSSSCISEVERETINYITGLEQQQRNILRGIQENNAKIREFELDIQDMKFNIDMFSEECKRFIEFKYGENKSIDWIATEIYAGARSTAYRKREEILDSILMWSNIVK